MGGEKIHSSPLDGRRRAGALRKALSIKKTEMPGHVHLYLSHPNCWHEWRSHPRQEGGDDVGPKSCGLSAREHGKETRVDWAGRCRWEMADGRSDRQANQGTDSRTENACRKERQQRKATDGQGEPCSRERSAVQEAAMPSSRQPAAGAKRCNWMQTGKAQWVPRQQGGSWAPLALDGHRLAGPSGPVASL